MVQNVKSEVKRTLFMSIKVIHVSRENLLDWRELPERKASCDLPQR